MRFVLNNNLPDSGLPRVCHHNVSDELVVIIVFNRSIKIS